MMEEGTNSVGTTVAGDGEGGMDGIINKVIL